jgi:L-fuculose-phosphate aldolase
VISASGHGGVSARLADGILLLTSGALRGPTGRDAAVITLDGAVLDGRLEPTTAGVAAQHAVGYRARPNVGAVVHTHSPHAAACAAAGVPLPCAYEPPLRYGLADVVPVAPWAPWGSEASVGNVAARRAEHLDVPAVRLGNHGLLAFGATPTSAAQLVLVLEEAARLALAAGALGGASPFPAGAGGRVRERMRAFGSAAFGGRA